MSSAWPPTARSAKSSRAVAEEARMASNTDLLWKLQADGVHVYMESMEKSVDSESPSVRRNSLSEGFDLVMSLVRNPRKP